MIFISAGEVIEIQKVGYRSLGFGEKMDLVRKQYSLTLEIIDFPKDFLDRADSFIKQCKLDYQKQGYPDIENLEVFRYPKFIELLKTNTNLAADIIKDYLYFDLLESIFPNSKNLNEVINSISNITANSSRIKITGKTFEFKPT